ncbi:recombinase RecA [Acidipila rosea]|nr:recombinase RecA [Acidipila rosea]
MTSASSLRVQIESALAHKLPSALTPRARVVRPTTPTGIDAVDGLLEGGLPVGALTEIVGPESSGRTSLALSSIAQLTAAGKVCAWVDVGDMLKPECAAAAGIALPYLLWVRCGIFRESVHTTPARFKLPQSCLVRPEPIKGLHGGGCGTHPRQESKSVARALEGFFGTEKLSNDSVGSVLRPFGNTVRPAQDARSAAQLSPWARIEQALKVTDLLLQGGGFSAVVLDMASLSAKYTSRIPLAHWFRYRAAAEHSRSSVLLLSQHACANSSAGLVLHLDGCSESSQRKTVLTAGAHRLQIHRQRFMQESNVIPMKKPVTKVTAAEWETHAAWAGRR